MKIEENDDSNAKQGAYNMTPCKLEDIFYLEDVTHYWSINERGEPVDEQDHTGGDYVGYVCTNCNSDFKHFKNAKEHLNGR